MSSKKVMGTDESEKRQHDLTRRLTRWLLQIGDDLWQPLKWTWTSRCSRAILIALSLLVVISAVLRLCRGYDVGLIVWQLGFFCAMYVAGVFFLKYVRSHFDIIRSAKLKVGGFCVLFFIGTLTYLLFPVNRSQVEMTAARPTANMKVGSQCVRDATCSDNNRMLFLEAPNRAISAFFRSQGGMESPVGDGWGEFCYYLFHLLVVLYLAALGFAYLGVDMLNRLSVSRCKPGETLVVWGYSHKAELLVQNLKGTGIVKDVVFMLPHSDQFDEDRKKKLINEITRLKGGTASEKDKRRVQCHWKFVDAEHLDEGDLVGNRNFFLSESGRSNIALAQKVIARARTENSVFYVRVETSADEKYFSTWIDPLCKKGVDIRIIKESEQIAESLVVEYPVEMRIPPDVEPGKKCGKDLRVLLIGLGTNGKSVLHKTIENSQCPWRDFSADIIDTDYAVWRAYKHSHEEAAREYHLKFVRLTFGTPSFSNWLKEAIGKRRYDRIMVCLGDDKKSMSLCSEIERIQRETFPKVPETPVYVQMDEPYVAFCNEKNEENGSRKEMCLAMAQNIRLFGTLKGVYDLQKIDDPYLLNVAKRLNYWYHGDDDEAHHKLNLRTLTQEEIMEQEWKSSDCFSKCSNRAAAIGQDNLLRMLGYERRSKQESGGSNEIDEQEFEERIRNGRILEVLAECEHMRWNAFHFVRGIRTWDLKSPTLNDVYDLLLKQAGLTRDCLAKCRERPEEDSSQICFKTLKGLRHQQLNLINAHAALVPFAKLPETDASFNNFLSDIMSPGGKHATAADFVGENRQRVSPKPNPKIVGDQVIERLEWGRVDAMQENDYKFCRTLWKNVEKSNFVVVQAKQKEN